MNELTNVKVTNDKGKITLLIFIIIIVCGLLLSLITIAVLDVKNSTKAEIKLNVKENKNLGIKDITEPKTTVVYDYEDENEEVEEETTEVVTTSEVTTTESVTTTVPTTVGTTKVSTTKRVITTKKVVTNSVQSVNPHEGEERTIVTTPSTYPNSKGDYEIAVLEMINAERKKSGLNEISMSLELRNLAEEAAELMYGKSETEVKKYLSGYNNYRLVKTGLPSASYLFERAKNIGVVTNSSLKYVGVGVIYIDEVGTLSYVLIYE